MRRQRTQTSYVGRSPEAQLEIVGVDNFGVRETVRIVNWGTEAQVMSGWALASVRRAVMEKAGHNNPRFSDCWRYYQDGDRVPYDDECYGAGNDCGRAFLSKHYAGIGHRRTPTVENTSRIRVPISSCSLFKKESLNEGQSAF